LKSKSASSPAVRVYIIGESPLVEEYAEVCSSHGYNVTIAWNKKPAQDAAIKLPDVKINSAVPANISLAIELTNIDLNSKKENIERLGKSLPETTPILTSSLTVTATEQSSWISGKHRLIGFSALPTLIHKPLVEIAPTVFSPKETVEIAGQFFHSLEKEIEIVQDRIGMVLPRILCRIINEAAFAVMEDIASPQDIDTALKLGVNFPRGPFEWAEQIGWKQIIAVLTALHNDVQEERYRIAPLLKQLALTRE
jgi:3-hydroxybutyryl-CoA dehydrogenase